MPYVLIKHRVKEFSTWKTAFDDHKQTRKAATLADLYTLRDVEDSNHVVLLFKAEDMTKARAFAASAELKDAMKAAGVKGKPDIYFLE